jgi:hypothetical protein
MRYQFYITQTNDYEVIIEADNEEEAIKIFDDYIVDDFGEPVTSRIDWQVSE